MILSVTEQYYTQGFTSQWEGKQDKVLLGNK
jgi:hypothetical protein